MKFIKQHTIFISLLLLSGCCYYSPWFRIDYINERTHGKWYGSIPPNIEKYSDLIVQNAFIKIYFVADSEKELAAPPYSIFVDIVGNIGEHKSVSIYNVKIESNLDRTYDVIPVKTDISNKTIEKLKFPLNLNFKKTPHNGKYSWAYFHSSYTLDFDYQNNEKIIVIIDIEVWSKNGSERKKIAHDFVPKIDSGFLKCAPLP